MRYILSGIILVIYGAFLGYLLYRVYKQGQKQLFVVSGGLYGDADTHK